MSGGERVEYFISFGGADVVAATTLVRAMKQHFDITLWFDREEVKGGEGWFARINDALRGARGFIICIGANPISFYCDKEIAAAMERQKHDAEFTIIPVYLPGAATHNVPLLAGYAAIRIANPVDRAQLEPLAAALKKGAPRPPPFDWHQALRQSGARAIQHEVAALQHKYVSTIYVDRSATQEHIETFLSGDSRVFALLGEAGAGKTNIACTVASKQCADRPVFMLRASALGTSSDSIGGAVRSSIEEATGQRVNGSTFEVLHTLVPDAHILIIIDAINEALSLNEFAECLAATIYRTRKLPMQFLLTCRRADWRFFNNDSRIADAVWLPPGSQTSPAGGSATLSRFTDAELDRAWPLYKAHFSMADELAPNIRNVCLHPLMLRFLCEAYRDKATPTFIETMDVFNRYWETKVSKPADPRASAALMVIADRMRQLRCAALSEDDLVQLVNIEAYNQLLSEEIILHVHIDPITQGRLVGFMYEAFFEYCIARAILTTEKWSSLSPQVLAERLRALSVEAEGNRTLVGVVEFILLFFQDRGEFEVLVSAIDTSPEWQQTICALLPRLRTFDHRFGGRLHDYVSGPHYWVRWAAAFAASRLNDRSKFLDLAGSWLKDDQWEVREGAANAIANAGVSAVDWPLLKEAARDRSWRVRRAVAHCINGAVKSGTLPFRSLEELAADVSWRCRDVAVISHRGLLIDPDFSCRILADLAADENLRVRFDLAKFIGTIPSASHALPLLERLALDEHEWIRRRAARSIAGFLRSDFDLCSTRLEALARDADAGVRWEVARVLSLHRPQKGSSLDNCLHAMAADSFEPVRIAAEFGDRYPSIGRQDFEKAMDFLATPLLDVREAIARVEDAFLPPAQARLSQVTVFSAWRAEHYPGIIRAIDVAADRMPADRFIGLLDLLRSDVEEGVRWALAQSVGALPVETSVRSNIVKGLLRDRHVWVRQAMLEEMTADLAASTEGLDVIFETLMQDDDPDLRLALATTTTRLRRELAGVANRVLHTLCNDADVEVRRAALVGLES